MKFSLAHFSYLTIADISNVVLLLSSISFHDVASSVNYWVAKGDADGLLPSVATLNTSVHRLLPTHNCAHFFFLIESQIDVFDKRQMGAASHFMLCHEVKVVWFVQINKAKFM